MDDNSHHMSVFSCGVVFRKRSHAFGILFSEYKVAVLLSAYRYSDHVVHLLESQPFMAGQDCTPVGVGGSCHIIAAVLPVRGWKHKFRLPLDQNTIHRNKIQSFGVS